MTLEELYKKLDMETPEDFSYFEQLAELLENEEPVDFGLFKKTLSALNSETAENLLENYFEELSDALPDSEDDMASLIEFIKQKLLMGARNLGTKGSETDFAQQLYAFRDWYQKPGGVLVDGVPSSVLSAVAELRAEKLGFASHEYDFTASLDYDLDGISLNLGAFSNIDILGGETI